MATSYFDSPRPNRDRPGFSLPDKTAALIRTFVDRHTILTDLVRPFPVEELAERTVLIIGGVPLEPVALALTDGGQIVLDPTGAYIPATTRELVVPISGIATAAGIAAALAQAVSGWTSLFQAVRVGETNKVGIYTDLGVFAIASNTAGWSTAAEEDVPLTRPGMPAECIPGYYHPSCPYLRLINVQQGPANDTHTEFTRYWQVDLARLDEYDSVDVESLLQQGKLTGVTLDQDIIPPRQFLPWVETHTSMQKAVRGSAPDAEEDVVQSMVTPESLAASAKQTTRTVYAEPVPLISQSIDPATGEVRLSTQIPVRSADAEATAIDETGAYTQIQPVNSLWSIMTTEKAAGLAGKAVKGRAQETWQIVKNHSWPAVLDYIYLQPVYADLGDSRSQVADWIVAPVFAADAYSGSCIATVTDRWTLAQPVVGGDPAWSTAYWDEAQAKEDEADVIMATDPVQAAQLRAEAEELRALRPDIPAPDELLASEINFRGGGNLRVYVKPCLHGEFTIWDSGFVQRFAATTPTRWPQTIIASVDVQQEFGGWRTRVIQVDAPSIAGLSSGIDLTVTATGGDEVSLEWTAGAGDATLSISSSPSFEGGHHEDYRDKPVTGSSITVGNLTRGVVYYCQITRLGVKSNIVAAMTKPLAELGVEHEGRDLADGEELDVTLAPVGESITRDIRLKNIGLLPLKDISATLSGDHAGDFSIAPTETRLEAKSTGAPVTITFTPGGVGARSALLTVTSNDETSPFELHLTGAGARPDMRLEDAEGAEIPPESTVSFGYATTGSISRSFTLKNIGNAKLEGLALNITGANVADFPITEDLPATELNPGGELTFTVVFDPVDNEDAVSLRSAVLTIAGSDADAAALAVTLSGTYYGLEAAGVVDETLNALCNGSVHAVAFQPDGKLLVGGAFTLIGGAARENIARLNADGSLDEEFEPTAGDSVHAIALQADGKIILGGEFSTVNSTGRANLARLHADGTLDTDYDPAPNGDVRSLALQSDGKLLVGGAFTGIAGGTRHAVARLNADGSLDTGFATELTGGVVNSVLLRGDGKVMITGDWSGTYVPPTTTTPPPTTTTTTTSTTTSTTTTTPTEPPTTSTTTTTPTPTTTTEEPTTTPIPTTTTTPQPELPTTTTTLPPTTSTTTPAP